MSKNLFDKLSPAAAFAAQLCAAAGLDFPALLAAGDVNALKTKLDAAASGAGVAEAITAATGALETENATLTGNLNAAKSEVAFYTQALSTAGITLKPADAAKGLQASDVQSALSAHIATKTAELAAQQGTKAVGTAPKGSQQAAGIVTYTEFQAMNPAAKAAFLKSGGEITNAPALNKN